MARRNAEDSPISLFSFQDIITSITGIMFMTVLLLVLIMLTSHYKEQNDPVRQESTRLEQELESLKKKLQALTANRSEMAGKLSELRKLTPAELDRKKRELQSLLQQNTMEMKKLEQQLQQQQTILKNMQNELEILQQQLALQQEKSQQLPDKLKKTVAEIKELEQKLQQQKKLMQFTIQSSSSKTPILMELSKSGIQLLNPDTQERHEFRIPDKGFTESMARLEKFLSQLPPEQYYFSITVKPEAFRNAAMVSALLQKNLFDRTRKREYNNAHVFSFFKVFENEKMSDKVSLLHKLEFKDQVTERIGVNNEKHSLFK